MENPREEFIDDINKVKSHIPLEIRTIEDNS